MAALTIRKSPQSDRVEADAVVGQINALLADLAALSLAGNNILVGADAETAVVADLLALRTPLAAGVVDLGVLRTPIVALIVDIAAMLLRSQNSTLASGKLADGTTAGKIKTLGDISYRIGGAVYAKAATDDLWDLSAKVDTDGTHYRSYWLYLDSAGTATVVAGTDALTSAANAIAALPAVDATKSVIGVYTAGPSTDFNGGAGLDSFGDYINGWPTAYAITATTPAALTATTPAAMTAVAPTSTNIIKQGTTAGKIKANQDLEFDIGGTVYVKAATDDLWNLTALVTLSGTAYRATALYLDASGTASIASAATSTTAAGTIALLEAVPATKARIGVYVAAPLTNYGSALDAQGTYYVGMPTSAAVTAVGITLVSA